MKFQLAADAVGSKTCTEVNEALLKLVNLEINRVRHFLSGVPFGRPVTLIHRIVAYCPGIVSPRNCANMLKLQAYHWKPHYCVHDQKHDYTKCLNDKISLFKRRKQNNMSWRAKKRNKRDEIIIFNRKNYRYIRGNQRRNAIQSNFIYMNHCRLHSINLKR